MNGTVAGAIALRDEDLAFALWHRLTDAQDDDGLDYLYVLVSEVLERWSPSAAWAAELRLIRETYPEPESTDLMLAEISHRKAAMRDRQAARIIHGLETEGGASAG